MSAGAVSPAVAQPGAAASETRNASQLEEVFVTARRIEESLQDTPISVAVFSQTDLRRMGVSEAGDIAAMTPNLVMRKNPASESNYSIAIRGLATSDPVLTMDPTVGLYQDGVYIARSAGMAFDIVDLQRIEVLRGPQGTLYGRNTIGGAINLITEKPRGELALRQELGAGNRGRERIKTTLDLPRVAGVAVRLSGLYDNRDGLVESLYDGKDLGQQETLAARLALNWAPLDTLNVDYTYDWSERDTSPSRIQISHMRDTFSDPDALFYGGAYYDSVSALSGAGRMGRLPIASTGDDAATADTRAHSLTLEWDLAPDLTFKSITSYRDFELITRRNDFGSFRSPEDGSVCPSAGPADYDFITGTCLNPVPAGELVPIFAGSRLPQAQDQWTQEFQFIGNALDDRLRFTTGLYYFEEEGEEFNPQRLVLPAPFIAAGISPALIQPNRGNTLVINNPNFRYTTDNESYAVYSELTYSINPELEATLGLRYTEDKRETTLTNSLSGELQTLRGSDSWSNFTPEFTLRYHWAEGIMLYGKVSSGYRAGGFNVRATTVSGFGTTFDEENVTGYEVGWKTELLDRSLRFNGALFYADYTDQQIPQFEAGSGGASTVVVNAGEATHSGLELEAVWLPFAGMKIAASYAYLNVDFDEFIGNRLDPETGFAVNPGVNEELSDIVSTDRYAPDHSGSLTLEYEFEPWQWGQLSARTDISYTDGIDFTSQLTRFDRSDSHTLVNARISLSQIAAGRDGSLEVSLWGKNLTDKAYRESGIDFGQLGFATNNYAELRSYGIEFVYSYNR